MALPVSTALDSTLEAQKKQQELQLQEQQTRQSFTNFPYVQEGQMIPLAPIAKQTSLSPKAATTGSPIPTTPAPTPEETLEAARKKAVGGYQSPAQGQMNELMQKYLQDPNLGYDPAKAKQATMEDYDRQRAQGFEAYRQATGGLGGIGRREEELLGMQLAGAQERTALGQKMDVDASQRQQDNLLKALAAGREQVGQESGIYSQDIQNMINAAGGALGWAELATKKEIYLQDKEFNAAQAELKRRHEIAMQGNDINAQRESLKAQLDFEATQAKLGRAFTESQNALNRTLQESLAYLDVNAQKEFITLKGNIDKGMLMTQQDFQGGQAELDRLMKEAMQKNDIQAQFDLQKAQTELTKLMADEDRKWKSAERVATEGWQSGERLSEEQWKSAEQYLERQQQITVETLRVDAQKALQDLDAKLKIALQSNDITAQKDIQQQQAALQKELQRNEITAQKEIQDMKAKLELQIQTQNMDHDEAMKILDASLEEAMRVSDFERQKNIMDFQFEKNLSLMDKENFYEQANMKLDAQLKEAMANGDFEKQKQIMDYKFNLDIQMLVHQGNYEDARMLYKNEMDKALQNNDFDHAKELQKKQLEQEMTIHQENLLHQQAKLALEQKGFDMQEIQMEYDRIQNEIAAGRLGPDSAMKYLKSLMTPEEAALLVPPDPNAWKDALDEDYKMQQYQFMQSHGLDPKAVGNFDANGNFLGLKNEYLKQYQDFVNNTIYGTDNTPTGEIISKFKSGEDDAVEYFSGKTTEDPMYKAFLNDNSVRPFTFDQNHVGGGSTGRYVFTNMPSVGGFLKYNGQIFRLRSKETDEVVAGTDYKDYMLVNVLTGSAFKISTGMGDKLLASQFENNMWK